MKEPKKKTRILIVDDDSIFRNLLVELFEGEGWKTASVFSGEDAIHELEAQCFDLAVVDLNLAGWISGLDFMREIGGICPKMPIIACSGQMDEKVLGEAMGLGARDFIEKPVEDLDAFLRLVKKIINEKPSGMQGKQSK